MRRNLLVILALLLLFCMGVVARSLWKRQAEKTRAAAYQAALNSFSAALQPGTSRHNVETYLRLKRTSFQRICCIDVKSAYADIVKIGEENTPWYCRAHSVYIAFQFAAATIPDERVKAASQGPSDPLQAVTLYSPIEGCL
jgi:hypothetical protein